MSLSSRRRPKRYLSKGSRYLLLSIVAFLFLAPFLWTVSGSLKSISEFLSYPPSLIPNVFRWDNYASVFVLQPFARQFLNSILVMAAVCVITLIVTTMAGYAFARVRMRGASVLFLLVLSGIFIPPEATILPLYRLVSAFGWIDSLLPLIVITAFITAAPVCTFIMRQAFLSLPQDFGEAATVDGAGRWRVFLQIYTPMVRPSMAAVIVLSCWHSWNQFLEPLIFLRSTGNFTVPLALTQYYDMAGPLWSVQAAATTVSVIPVIVVFFFAQKHVVAGLTEGGIKS